MHRVNGTHMVQVENHMTQPETITTTGISGPATLNNTTPWLEGSTSNWVNLQPTELGENKMLNGNSNKWEFNALHESFIDFADIDMELDGKNPMALVTHGDTERYVVVSDWLLMKAQVLKIDCLAIEKHLEGEDFVVYKIEDNFKEWVKWAKKIKYTPWPENRRKHNTVAVSLPKI